MAMSRKDYEIIAEAIKSAKPPTCSHLDCKEQRKALRAVTSMLSSAFMTDNPRFDPDKFTRACGF